MARKRLPIGLDSFSKIQDQDCYYVDKTGFIEELLNNRGEVNLFTRPRRFGKSLNMDMLKCFFEIGADQSLFDGLTILQNAELCEKYMGKYPVISITLKGVNADDFNTAREMLAQIISREAGRMDFLTESNQLSAQEKQIYKNVLDCKMSDATLYSSLLDLSNLLKKHFKKNVIILIDEYDVPLAKANARDYYPQMITVIRNLFGQTLKTNPSLEFAVLTGCLRVSKESIFTGLNNLTVYSLKNPECAQWFGFTEQEVKEMLHYYELDDYYSLTKEWYDGYRIGSFDVYNPWDVVNWVRQLRTGVVTTPFCYWTNSSGNHEVETLIQKMGSVVLQNDIERLMSGESITREVEEQLTYDTLYDSENNLWSLLFATGYLTMAGPLQGNQVSLRIPNEEIHHLFQTNILRMFQTKVQTEESELLQLQEGIVIGDVGAVEQSLNTFLRQTISIRDTASREKQKENFYQGLLLAILKMLGRKNNWSVQSNLESGDGYCDILVETDNNIGLCIEIKYAHQRNFDTACQKAMDQIDEMGYTQRLKRDGMQTILKYGIAFYKKECKVQAELESL